MHLGVGAAFAVETINAKTVDTKAKQEHKKPAKRLSAPIRQQDVYDGEELEIPNLIDILKPKIESYKHKDAISPEEAAKMDIKEASGENANANEQAEPKQSAVMNSDEMEYFDDRGEVEARGHVVITTKPDNTKLSADKAVYNKNENVIRLFGNVVLEKDNSVVYGDFMSVDLNEENVLMNEPAGRHSNITFRAHEGWAYANELQTINGEAELADDMEMVLASNGFGYYDQTIYERFLGVSELQKTRSEPLKIKTKEIIIESKRDHDTITFKNLEVFYKKFKVANADNAQILTDKGQNYVETNLPEVGMIRDFGTYVGWGPAFALPYGGTFKIMPALVYDSGVGLGVIGRLSSKRNMLYGAWATNSKNLVVKGKYKLNDNIYFDYGRHAFFDEWFQGGRRPGYIFQAVHDKTYNVADLGAKYRQRFSAGYVTDWAKGEHDNKYGTMRLRWQGELSRQLFSIENEEQDMFMKLFAYAQGSATVYGTGDVVGIGRFGPTIQTRVRNWGSRISYGIAGVHNKSPFIFDQYIYGKQYINIDENIRFGKYLALGYQGTISLLKDNPNKDLLTENKFYAIVGPEDLKLGFAYDTYRDMFYFDVLFVLGADKNKIQYEKLTAKNMHKMQKETSPFENLKYYRVKVPETL